MKRMISGILICILCLLFSPVEFVHTEAADIPSESGKNTGEILISDLARLVDTKFINEKDTNLWKTIPYQTENFSGIMIGDGGGPNPVPITIRLGVKGLYRVFLGIYSGYSIPKINVRLSRDISCQTIGLSDIKLKDNVYERGAHIYEIHWKEADLSGQDIILEGADDPNIRPSALAYIRLEPVSEIQNRDGKAFLPLTVTNDGHGIFSGPLHSCPDDLLKPFEIIPEESCMRILLWGNGCADNCNYPTKVGNFYHNAGRNYRNTWMQKWSMNMELWKKKGWNSIKVVRDYTKKRNWEFQVYIRMEAFNAQFPFDQQEHSNFFISHPEYHCFDRFGQRVGRLSYAHEEVRKHMLNLIREIAEFEPDGICLCFIRGVPLVLYEPVMVEGFKKKYGMDPRELEEFDTRWTSYQGEIITSFVRNVKHILKSGQRLSVIVPGNEFDCKRWGLDVSSWVKDCIVDDVFPVGQSFDHRDVHRDNPEHLDFTYFSQLEGRENIRLIPMLYPWDTFRENYSKWRGIMQSFIDQGADSYGVWDAVSDEIFPFVGDLGYGVHGTAGYPEIGFRRIKVLSVQGFRIDRYHMFESI
jgi:hypothetical protein